MEDIQVIIRDVERFLTQVLGKLSNLPADVNRERLDLVQRLQRHLNKPGIGFKKKLPVPIPQQASNEADGEDDVGEYGDVAAPQTPQTKIEEEMYDDVATQEKELQEENYDDVVAIKKQVEEKAESQTSEEFYDDVNGTQNKSLSSKSNNSDSLDAKEIGEPIKASDILDKIFEGELDKYKGKRPFKKWQRRYCVLTPKALYYYENKKDQKQKGQIMLPCGETILRPGCHSYSEVKDKKTCFELVTDERCYLFKAIKESDYDAWTNHLTSVLHADLSEEQSKLMRLFSVGRRDDDDDDAEGGEDLYECIDQMQQKRLANSSETEEMYELTDRFSSQVSESSASSGDPPTLPSRVQAPLEKQTREEEEFEEIDDKETRQTSDAFHSS
ncbi:src kinase-associated phosphoprotein 2-A-like isoform X2 [Xenia sp. Carnegie-2017]|uniref:src kinase-associated phosphoprotein 2-A-like isoform X2 n=1 Tax=Xenia sp. Carnegie-2017 TaxID=2897299 RepID=UPI001F03F5B3|nr:src kinase-associated phosphoprotein 2-A-like isoform X2 [Xenia sp. Carnegie-2017]